MPSHTLTVNVSKSMLEEIELYKTSAHKQNIEDAVKELLQYALTFSPRARLLEALRVTPDDKTGLSEEEQLALVDQVRQKLYEEKQGI